MLIKQPDSFGVRRYGIPIKEVYLKDAVNPGITASMRYTIWEAAIAAGATLDELKMIDEYPKRFLADLVAWHEAHKLVNLHGQSAAADAAKKRVKKK